MIILLLLIFKVKQMHFENVTVLLLLIHEQKSPLFLFCVMYGKQFNILAKNLVHSLNPH